MIHEHRGNLFELFSTVTDDNSALHIIAHGCNAQGKMGSGFAKELRNRYPMAYDDYKAYEKEMGFLRTGQISYSLVSNDLIIANCITQQYYGNDGKKYVSYDAVDDVFKQLNYLCNVERSIHVHFPKIGADLGGGNWNVIKEIIDHRLVNAEKHLYILK
ncbi:macro domain-containing protein [Escherichia phage ph0011]|nr:macro domain-containing protein [Escherichia phage ph0011]